jgi:hypothetical protein
MELMMTNEIISDGFVVMEGSMDQEVNMLKTRPLWMQTVKMLLTLLQCTIVFVSYRLK